MRRWVALLASLAVSGCAVTPVPTLPPEGLFADARFVPPSEPIDASQVFALNDSMRRFLREDIEPLARRLGAREALMSVLFERQRLKLTYDATITRNAAQAFDAGAGNCLSLAVMTAALAREMGVRASVQRVQRQAGWTRIGNLEAYSEHVNVVLGGIESVVRENTLLDDRQTIDFLPPEDLVRQRTTLLDDATVIAMYLNNRAAEALAAQHIDNAYWWARAAVQVSPGFYPAYNTLGLVYWRHGDTAHAERALRLALAADPREVTVLGNLADLLASTGRETDAAELRERLARLEPETPFAEFKRGMDAMREGHFEAARRHFKRELSRDPYYHEFHYWMAQASLGLGRVDDALEHLERAVRTAPTRAAHDRYVAGLDRLRAGVVH